MSKIIVACLLLVGSAVLGCQPTSTAPTLGSETHFLRRCSSDLSCGDQLACLCGICTASCDADSCSDLSDAAACVSIDSRPTDQSCGEASYASSCEVSCIDDSSCTIVDSKLRCDRGYCRQKDERCEEQGLAADQIVVLGDRFFADSGRIIGQLNHLAQAQGSIASNATLRDYSSDLVSPFGGTLDLTNQYASAQADGEFQAVIMDAGGPDALLDCPESTEPLCPSLQAAVDGVRLLLAQMHDDGVQKVLLTFYPEPEESAMAAKFDVLRPLLEAECNAALLGCHFLDLRPIFATRSDEFLTEAGLIPTTLGSDATAGALWDLMQLHCFTR